MKTKRTKKKIKSLYAQVAESKPLFETNEQAAKYYETKVKCMAKAKNKTPEALFKEIDDKSKWTLKDSEFFAAYKCLGFLKRRLK